MGRREAIMRCPFIREAHVKSCQGSSFRKMILEDGSDVGHERCSSPAYAECQALPQEVAREPIVSRCPWLRETLVEYCSAAAVTRFIPATEGLLPRCNSGRHRYCELYLAAVDPQGGRLATAAGAPANSMGNPGTPVVEGIAVPSHLSYAPNHMWLDVAEDGCCHVGVDAFLASVIGAVDAIGFVTTRNIDRPVAVLTVNGTDLQLVFPNPLEGAVPNAYLRTNPGKLLNDPYGAGWLFEGKEPTMPGAPVGAASRAGLIPADAALRWIYGESDRLAGFVHERISRPEPDGTRIMADGGRVQPGLAQHVDREDLINLFNEFFPPHAGWQRSW
jgi:glycine cleavage system H lipoate-binding protein